MDANTLGTIYLLHFDRPYRHARHYLGWTVNLEERMDKHLNGTGARLLEIITGEGIGFELVRTWPNKRLRDEKKMKKSSSTRFCPICNPKTKKC